MHYRKIRKFLFPLFPFYFCWNFFILRFCLIFLFFCLIFLVIPVNLTIGKKFWQPLGRTRDLRREISFFLFFNSPRTLLLSAVANNFFFLFFLPHLIHWMIITLYCTDLLSNYNLCSVIISSSCCNWIFLILCYLLPDRENEIWMSVPDLAVPSTWISASSSSWCRDATATATVRRPSDSTTVSLDDDDIFSLKSDGTRWSASSILWFLLSFILACRWIGSFLINLLFSFLSLPDGWYIVGGSRSRTGIMRPPRKRWKWA